jgi:beta-aspartyl-peptidase (threonine type)
MDASIMGEGESFGAVASLKNVRNPIRVARAVLAETDHWLLCGEGALAFARVQGFEAWNPVVPPQRERWEALRQKVLTAARGDAGGDAGGEKDPRLRWKKLLAYAGRLPETKASRGTVGAVALDASGRTAAATSTGGMWLKLSGRVGDSALPGAGTWVGPGGASSATGHGEAILRVQLTRRTERLLRDFPAQEAATRAITEAREAGCECGVLAVDRRGEIGFAFNTMAMPVEVWRA